jgi:hypothetical protein
MKTKFILRTIGLLIMMTSLFALSSCTKQADGDLTKEQKEQQGENLEASSIDETDFTESDEDLTTVDYKEFYDQLTSHGEWVQVRPEEIGLPPKTASLNNTGSNSGSLSNLFGIKGAYASSSENPEILFVWKPSTDLAVVSVVGEAPVYVPYSNGQWVNTDAGWYFKAPTPEEEIVHHYGRWVNSPTDGWLWVPGRVWAPAWVDWRQNDTYLGWAPLPPSAYIVDNTINVPPIDYDRYVIVEKRYFVQPQIYKYMYKENKNKIMIKEMTKTNGIMIINKTVINKGPEVTDIEKYWGNKVEMVNINRVKVKNDVKYSDKEYYVYTPNFTKVKHSKNVRTPIFQPKSFKKYDERNVRKSDDKGSKKEEKELRKENNGNNSGVKEKGNQNKDYKESNKKGQDGNNDKILKEKNVKENKSNGKGNSDKERGNNNGNNGKGKK